MRRTWSGMEKATPRGMLMKKFIFFAVAVMVAGAAFATETGTDSAANAAYGDGWATGDNGSDSGDAFGQWDLIAGGSADSYIG